MSDNKTVFEESYSYLCKTRMMLIFEAVAFSSSLTKKPTHFTEDGVRLPGFFSTFLALSHAEMDGAHLIWSRE